MADWPGKDGRELHRLAASFQRTRSAGITATSLITRRATAADIPALFRIRTAVRENALSRARLAAAGVTPRSVRDLLGTTGAAWIAEEAGRALGFSMVDAAQGTVFAVFVLPGQEGRGIGRALLILAEDWLAAQGWRQAWLLTGADPALRAPGFYRRMGWRARGQAPRGERRFVRDLILSRPRGVP